MHKQKAIVECVECQREFQTSSHKHPGDKFQCHHCGHSMMAEIDWGEDGQIVWFAVTDKTTKKSRSF